MPCLASDRQTEAEHVGVGPMNFASPFSICIVAITALALFGLPVGYAMIAGSIIYLMLVGQDLGTVAEQLLNGMYQSWILLAVPLFILAAEVMNTGTMTERLLRFCEAMVGRFRGGLAQVNVVQSIIFAGMSGSAIADAAGSGRLMQNMMTRDGKYTPSFAAALTAVSSVIAPIIPPSIPLVLYALVSDASIGYLFIAGIVPGLLLGLSQMIVVAILARRRNFPVEPPVNPREIPGITLRAFPALMMPVVLLVGMRGGVMTPTEASAVAAAYAHPDLGGALSQPHAEADLRCVPGERPLDRLDRHADRRRARLQLRRHDREHPGDRARRPRAVRR